METTTHCGAGRPCNVATYMGQLAAYRVVSVMDGGDLPRIDVRVIRIREPRTIADPRIKLLFERAVHATRYPGTTALRLHMEIAARIRDDLLGVFIGLPGPLSPATDFNEFMAAYRGPKALAIVSLPNSATMWAPVVNLAYSESRELSVMIGARIREWVSGKGYDRILGMNLYHDDEAFCRTFRHMGETAVVGSVVEARL